MLKTTRISQELSTQILPGGIDDQPADDSGLLGGDDVVDTDNASAVAAAVRKAENADQIIQVTEQVISDAKQAKKEQIDRKYLSKRLRTVDTILTELIASTVDIAQSDLHDVPQRIESIEKSIATIKGWLT